MIENKENSTPVNIKGGIVDCNMDDAIICGEYIVPAPKPAMLGEPCLFFEHDFPIQEVSEILGVHATNCGRQNDMKINPITGKKNPGYWEYSTPKTQGYDCDCVIDMLHSFISLQKTAFTSQTILSM